LEELVRVFGAQAAFLQQLDSEGASCGRVEGYDCDAHRMLTPRNRPSLASDILAPAALGAKNGSVWIMSETIEAGALRLLADRRRLEDYRIRDVAVIPLQSGPRGRHVLELQFVTRFPEHQLALLCSIAGMLASLWSGRAPGTIMEARLSRVKGPERDARDPVVNVLSSSNPLRLTRAEYRVCMLVRGGYRAQQIADELDVQDSTVRTHLRAIYAKANVSGHVGLLHLLSGNAASNGRSSASGPVARRA
jgi:DNA-binding CsgD family transcriptional regulator